MMVEVNKLIIKKKIQNQVVSAAPVLLSIAYCKSGSEGLQGTLLAAKASGDAD